MHHLLRRAGTGALAAALALSVAACGDDDQAPAETGEAPTTAVEETTTTAAE